MSVLNKSKAMTVSARYWLMVALVFALATPFAWLVNPGTILVAAAMVSLPAVFFAIRPLLMQAREANQSLIVPSYILPGIMLEGAIMLVETFFTIAITEWKVMFVLAITAFAVGMTISGKRRYDVWLCTIVLPILLIGIFGMRGYDGGAVTLLLIGAWLNYRRFIKGERSFAGAVTRNVRLWPF